MGKASATPEKLFHYSDQTTRTAGDLAAWVRGSLAQYIAAFQAGAIDYGNDIRGITGSHRGGDTIGIEVNSLLTRVWETDRGVKDTGRAFATAGGGSGRTDLGLPHWTMGPVHTTDAAVEAQANSNAMAAGAELARSLPGMPGNDPVARLTAKLAEHSSDPYFAAGFFNALTPEQLKMLLPINQDTIPALVSAYRSGALNQSVTDTLIHKLVSKLPESVDSQAFLSALADNHVASAHFANSINSSQIFGMLSPNRGTDGVPKALLEVLTSATHEARDPEEIKSWINKLSSALLNTPKSGGEPTLAITYPASQLKAIVPYLMGFARACGAHLLLPPPKRGGSAEKYGDALTKWANDSGENMKSLSLLGKWIELDRQALADQAKSDTSMKVGALVALVTGGAFLLPELASIGAVNGLLIQTTLGVAASDAQSLLTDTWTADGINKLDRELTGEISQDLANGKIQPDKAMNEFLRRRAKVLFTLQALASGTLVGDEVNLRKYRGEDGLERLARQLNSPEWALKQRVKEDKGRSLDELLKLLVGPMK
ncbi:hypothetical protein AB0D24_17210 [Streptomyces javensis]|uniref:hypothetical protein n=1 Tax=Streptomyces javensis TaxID=114698 RepID=UPI0033E48A1E